MSKYWNKDQDLHIFDGRLIHYSRCVLICNRQEKTTIDCSDKSKGKIWLWLKGKWLIFLTSSESGHAELNYSNLHENVFFGPLAIKSDDMRLQNQKKLLEDYSLK